MKKFIGIAASFACVLALGAQAQAGELFDGDRFMASLEDSYNGYTYRNIHNYDSFVAALEDNHEGHYRNIHNSASFVAALEDGFEGYNYRNMHNYDSFVASLGDGHEGYYRNIHNSASFVAALEDGYSDDKYVMASTGFEKLMNEKHEEEAVTAAYSPRPCEGSDMDFLSDSIVLAKLTTQCE